MRLLRSGGMALKLCRGGDAKPLTRPSSSALHHDCTMRLYLQFPALNLKLALRISGSSTGRSPTISVNSMSRRIFFRGLIPSLRIPLTYIDYDADERLHGETKYTMRKMFRLALDGVLATTVNPLRLSAVFCLLSTLAFFGIVGYVIAIHITKTTVPGWTSLVCRHQRIRRGQLSSVGDAL